MWQEKFSPMINALTELGFTDLEAVVYCYLVENSPATPYRVAKDIGRPVANTYKAVQSLYQKGILLIDETKNRLCQAVNPSEALMRLKSTFQDRHDIAESALSHLKPTKTEERIYSLATAEQVFERCKGLMDAAESVILVDAYPGIVKRIQPWLETASKRHVKVILQTYSSLEIEGVETIEFQSAKQMLRRWKGNWLIVVVDGAEYLFSYLGDNGQTVHNAIWARSAFLALPQHCNLAMSMRASLLEKMIDAGESNTQIKQAIKKTAVWLTLGKRGYEELADKFV